MSGILLASSSTKSLQQTSTDGWWGWEYDTGYSRVIFSPPTNAKYQDNYQPTWYYWNKNNTGLLTVSIPNNAIIDI